MHGEIVTSQRNLGPFSRQSNESHVYPSRPFIAMSYFISFEPLIVRVSMLLPLCRLALDETFSSRPASDSHTLSHENSQEAQEEEEEDHKCQVSSWVRFPSLILRNSTSEREGSGSGRHMLTSSQTADVTSVMITSIYSIEL